MDHRGLCAALLALCACDTPPLDTSDADPGSLERVATFPAAPRPLDLMLVIDDSPSMTDKQAALAAMFPQLLSTLGSFDGGLPDLRVGVVSTDMGVSSTNDTIPGAMIGQVGAGGCSGRGKNGAFVVQPNVLRAGANVNYLSHPRGGQPNYEGTLADALGAQVRLGAGGCGFEQTLGAMKAALGQPANTGFVRADASLAVLILSDEDDCTASTGTLFAPESSALGPLQSFRCFRFGVECTTNQNQVGVKSACRPRTDTDALLDDVAEFRTALLAAKGGDERKVLVGAMVAPPDPVEVVLKTPPGGGTAQPALGAACSYTTTQGQTASGDPAVRIAALVDNFPGRHVRETICDATLGAAASSIGSELQALIVGDRCLWRAIAPTEGCEVVDETGDAPAVALAECSSGETPCYTVVVDSACSAGLRLDVARTQPAPANTFTTMRCRR